MSSGQKVAFSLLISVLAFCAFTVVAFSGLFDLLEVNFYQPIVQEIKQKKIEEIAAAQNEYFDILMKRFDAFSVSPAVKTYADSHPSDASAKNREMLRSQLVTSTSALTGIRIIAANGRNIFFSTFSSDVISGKNGISYRNYDTSDEISFDSLSSRKLVEGSSPSDEKCRIIKDGQNGRLIYSLPFYNSENTYFGTILFYCDASNFSEFLFNRNLIDIKGFATLVTDPPNSDREIDGFGGFVFGLPNYGRSSVQSEILKKWRSGDTNFWKLNPAENPSSSTEKLSVLEDSKNDSLCAFSYKNTREDFGFITLLYNDSELKFPPYIRILLLVTAFVTLYLAVFLILSFKHDDIVVIRDKVRRYENEFFISWQKMGEGKTENYLADQKPVLERRILKSLGKKGEKHAAEFKSIFEGYWQEMLACYGENSIPLISGASAAPAINADELKKIVRSSLEDILENGKIQINAVQVENEKLKLERQEPIEKTEPAEELEAEEVENVEPAEELEAEETEAVEEAETAEELDEVEPLEETEEIEDAEEVLEPEEIAEAEEVESVEEMESVEEAEDVESLEEAEPAEELEAEEAEAVEEAETAEELDEVEPLEEADEVEDAEEVLEPEEIAEAEEVESVEEMESVEEAEDAESLEDAEPAEEVSEPEELDEVDELDELDEVEPAEELEAEEAEAVEEAETVEELDEVEPLEEAEEIEDAEEVLEPEEIEELTGINNEAEASEELEPIADMNEELRLGDGRVEDDSSDDANFAIAGETELIQKFEDELEMLPEVSEHEERAFEIAKTLEALPDEAPRWTDNDDVELDSEGLSRKPSYSEMHDIEKLREVARSIDEMDSSLEELELIDGETSKNEENTSQQEEEYSIPEALIKKSEEEEVDNDDVYKDEALLEKIEFGVPSSEIFCDDSDDSVAENFVATSVDYSFLDEDESDEKLYEPDPANDITENEHYFENPSLMSTEDSAEIQDIEPVKNEIDGDEEDVEALEKVEETMPFMFTKFGSSCDTQIAELADMPDAIVQDSDGTFHVTEMPKMDSKISLDMEFKKLVDSILY